MSTWQATWSQWQATLLALAADGEIKRLFWALALLLAVWLFRSPLARVLGFWPAHLLRRTGLADQAQADALLQPPLRLLPLAAALPVCATWAALEGASLELAQRLALTLAAWAATRFVLALLPLLRSRWTALEATFGSDLVDWMAKGLWGAAVAVSGATILQLWGVQVGPIIAGAGLFGVAVALGAQAFFKNLIGGMLILAGKRFRKGDWIEVPGVVEGTVESIGFHATVVRRFDRAPVTLPNTMLCDAAVTNYSRRPHRRISWTLGLDYRGDADSFARVRERIEQSILASEDFLHPPAAAVLVRIDQLGDSGVEFFIYCFTHSSDWAEWLRVKEALALEVLRIVDEEGCALAYPSQTVYLQSDGAPSPRPPV